MTQKIESLNRIDADEFVELLGGIFEHSRWVAQAAVEKRPFDSRAALHAAMCAIVRGAPEARHLALLQAHPELAGREARADELTEDSKREQSRAGLDRCSADELEKIQNLNRAYRESFGFPFIIAVTGLDKYQIIAAMERRLEHDRQTEFGTALTEVEKIARIRIDQLIDE